LKRRILEEASSRPEGFFPVEKLEARGFRRNRCMECGKYFWSTDKDREVCGEAECSGGYTFIDNPPTEKKFSYTSAWVEFSKFMEKRGYTPIGRHPVLARWRDDTEFVRASIYDFQPYVVSGEVEPPANPLVIPQPSLRFNDIDNVGITGGHYVLHDHIGQHAFENAEDYNQDKYFEDILDWLTEGMGIPKEEITIHEDSWGGGGNLGTSLEFFVGGLELLNQVYMSYRVDESERGYTELDIKVLDMGMGHERIVWITNGSRTSYEANMPEVVEKLYGKTGVKPDEDIREKFLPYSGLLNADEVEDIEEKWKEISDAIGVEKDVLEREIQTSSDIYSIADHTRALLFAFVDGALPSNTGEKHSLRVIARRAMDIVDKRGWKIDLKDVMEWHAKELRDLFPELEENIDQARRIMEHEELKYRETREKARSMIEDLKGDIIGEKKLIHLYDTHGISPEMLERFGIDIERPRNFYSKISERHGGDIKKQVHGDELDLDGVPMTKRMYTKDEKKVKFKASVEKIIDKEGKKYVILDRTCFYPTQGGQMNDIGTINGSEVLDAINKDGIILHTMEHVNFSEGESVEGKIDWKRRKQLMQHHTATHIINGAAREILGGHVSQAGAKKTEKKARLDITHYKNIDKDEMDRIEDVARKWIEDDYPVKKTVMKKSEAERQYGFQIYQGGVPPENKLRIIDIGNGLDVEACGGTHVDSTGEVEDIVITKSTKIQDGVVRMEFKSGEAARQHRKSRKDLRQKLDEFIDIEGRTLEEVADIFDVSVENLFDVVQRFIREWEERKDKIEDLKDVLGRDCPVYEQRPRDPKSLFKQWKIQGKDIESLEQDVLKGVEERVRETDSGFIRKEVPVGNLGNLIRTINELKKRYDDKSVLIRGTNAVVAYKGDNSNINLRKKVEREANVVKEENGIFKGFDLK